MRFHVLTLFPEMILQGLNTSIIGRAVESGHLEIEAIDIRKYSTDKHGKVDDYPYGGGAGMLMQAQPVYDAWRAVVEGIGTRDKEFVRWRKKAVERTRTVYVTPKGRTFTQQLAAELAEEEELIFLCGHYEGIDERVLEEVVTDYVSIGDYVLTGGELPAMVMIDAIARLVPGVLHNDNSAVSESFYNDLLEYPQYSRPEVWHGKEVPAVLLSGDHRKVEQWRLEQAVECTKRVRPDLYERYERKQKLIRLLSKDKRNYIHMMESLSCGTGQILYWEGENVLLHDTANACCMLTAASPEACGILMEYLPEKLERVIVSGQCGAEFLEKYGRESICGENICKECVQFLYTQKVPLPVKHKEICRLDREQLAQDAERFWHDKEDVECFWHDEEAGGDGVRRFFTGTIYGAFVDGSLAGVIRCDCCGCMDYLYVDEAYRGQGIEASLEAYGINRLLEAGRTPHCQISAERTEMLAQQEQLGLYRAGGMMWRLEGKNRQKTKNRACNSLETMVEF